MPELLLLPLDLSPTHDEDPVADDPERFYLASLSPASRRSVRSSLRAISPQLPSEGGRVRWELVRYRHVAALRAWLVDTYAPATAARHLHACWGVLREAHRLELLSADDWLRARAVRPVAVRQRRAGRLVGEDDAERLSLAAGAGAVGARDRALFRILLSAGLRRSELVGADLQDYDPLRADLFVRSVKHGAARTVCLDAAAAGAVSKWLAWRGSGWDGPLLTAVDQCGQVVRRRLTPGAVNFLLRRLSGRACVGRLSPHDLRKSFHRNAIDPGGLGLDLFQAARLLGHASISTSFEHYDIRQPPIQHLREAGAEHLAPGPATREGGRACA